MKNIFHSALCNPTFYHYVRGALNFGYRYKPVVEMLAPNPSDSILDVACGVGNYSKIVGDAQYLGIDLNGEYIEIGRKLFGNEKRRFEVQDAMRLSQRFPKNSFTKVLMNGFLHHVDDKDAVSVLSSLSNIVSGFAIVIDPFYSQWHLINNAICKMDRGKFVRKLEHQRRLLNEAFKIVDERIFFNKNLLTHLVSYKIIAAG